MLFHWSPLTLAATPPFCRMFQVSRDNPAYYLTSVAHHRLPIFQKDAIKKIVCDAFDEARKSAGILIFAYVIMLEHTHVLTDNAREMKEALRYLNGVSAKRLINYLKDNGYESSLAKAPRTGTGEKS